MTYTTPPKPNEPGTIRQWLSHADLDDRCGAWASNFSTLSHAYGLRVIVEGLDWSQACRDHGFYGAIMKAKAAAQTRYAQRQYWPTAD